MDLPDGDPTFFNIEFEAGGRDFKTERGTFYPDEFDDDAARESARMRLEAGAMKGDERAEEVTSSVPSLEDEIRVTNIERQDFP